MSEPRRPHMRPVSASTLFFLLGLAALGFTVHAVGLDALAQTLRSLQGIEYAALLFYPLICVWDAWGWRYAFPEPWNKRLGVASLFWVRLAGEAVNNTTPSLDVGGEPLKVTLLCRRFGVDKPSAIAGTVVAKALLFYSEVVFWLIALVPFLLSARVAFQAKAALAGVSVIAGLLGFGLYLLQRKGLFLTLMRTLERFRLNLAFLERLRTPLKTADDSMARFYTHSHRDAAIAFWLHFVSWLAGGVETWIFFRILDVPVSMGQAMVIEALLQLTRSASCFIPASLGVQEAGMALYASWFGAAGPVGVAVSLLKRARQLFWSAVGYGVWGYYERAGKASAS